LTKLVHNASQINELNNKSQSYLHKLCVEIPTRQVGSQGNRDATDLFADVVASYGFRIERQEFDCMDWTEDGVDLVVDGERFEAHASPYSLGCKVQAPLDVISTVKELEAADLTGKIALLQGEIAKEQLMPKIFPFYNPDEHKAIYQLLESRQPSAIISATSKNPSLAGAVYPFPLIEDGDFDIPSIYMTDQEGDRLSKFAGRQVTLASRATRIPSSGSNVIGRKGPKTDEKVVFFAHIDAKKGTPGAIDNATGVIILMLLSELLADYDGELEIEFVALNGEDYYAAPGEILWVQSNQGRFEQIILGFNMDGVGYREGNTAYSLYGLTDEVANMVRSELSRLPNMIEGQPWYQSDHSLFIQNGRPAVAFTSDAFDALWTEIAHTLKDRPEIIDPARLVDVALGLKAVLYRLGDKQLNKGIISPIL